MKIETKRNELIKKELATLQKAPQINKYKDNKKNDNKDFLERQKELAEQSQKRKEILTEKINKKKEDELKKNNKLNIKKRKKSMDDIEEDGDWVNRLYVKDIEKRIENIKFLDQIYYQNDFTPHIFSPKNDSLICINSIE